MSNPFADQLLKAGAVTKQQVQKAQQDKKKQNKQNRQKKNKPVDAATLEAQKKAAEKARRDKELNQKKEQQARQKAISIEINQLIDKNKIARDDNCDIIYNFEHQNKVKRIYVNADLKQQIINGKLGIGRIEGRYELVPISVAKKIQQRNEKRIVIVSADDNTIDENDPYKDYQIPDDLTW